MSRKNSKFFSVFWIFSGSIWLVVSIRHIMMKSDATGFLIYIIAFIVSFILAFAYYKDFVK